MFTIVTQLAGKWGNEENEEMRKMKKWGKTAVSLNLHIFYYIGTIQYYQLNLFCLMITAVDALPVSVKIYS